MWTLNGQLARVVPELNPAAENSNWYQTLSSTFAVDCQAELDKGGFVMP